MRPADNLWPKAATGVLRRGGLRAVLPLIRTARPRQWLKNLLVLAAPAAAGVLFHPSTAVAALVAFASFTLAAAAT